MNNQKYKCDICGQTFNDHRGFLSHKRSHTDQMIKCDICGQMCKGQGGLNKHMTMAHKKRQKTSKIINGNSKVIGMCANCGIIWEGGYSMNNCPDCGEKLLVPKKNLIRKTVTVSEITG